MARSPGHPAGERNNRVTVELNTPTVNDDGQKVAVWGTAFRTWAKIVPRGGRERWVFEQLRAEVSHIVRLLANDQTRGIKPATHRFNNGGQILNIESVIDVDTRRVELEFRCTEVIV